jgi:hypothetical protein
MTNTDSITPDPRHFSIRLPRPRWIGVAAVVLVVVGATFLVVSFHLQFGHRVVFIIPDGFRGGFVIFEDPNADDVPTKRGSAFVYVPESGELRVRSAEFFRYPSEWIAEFSSGKPLPKSGYLRNEPLEGPNSTGLWGGEYSSSLDHGWRYDFFVGTQREYDEFDREGFKSGVGASGR